MITTSTPETNPNNNTWEASTTPNIKSSIWDRVWLDINWNGLQDNWEIWVNDIKVELRRCDDLPTGTPDNIALNYNWILVDTTYTNNVWYYLFSWLDAGKYYVQFVTPNGYTWTTQYKDGYATYWLTNSNVNPVNGKTTCEMLWEWSHDSTIDWWLVLWNSISCDKLTISPMQISNSGTITYNCTGTNVTTWYLSIINQSGNITNIYNLSWSFILNTAGTYTAQCVVNSGITYGIKKFEFIKPVTCAYKQKTDGRYCAVQTSLAPYLSNNIDFSNLLTLPNPIPYCTSSELATLTCVDAPANSQILIRDENTCKTTITIWAWTWTASVWDKVWFDNNKDGIQDLNEPWISWAKVELYTCSWSLIATTFTNINGNYLFDKLLSGNYKVKFYPVTINWYNYNIRTTKNWTWSNADNDNNANLDWFTDCFTLVNDQNRRDIDAWVYYNTWWTNDCYCDGRVVTCGTSCWWWPTNYCGNGRIDTDNWITEQCDDWVYNWYASSNCNRNCKLKTNVPPSDVKIPKCDYVDPPSINKWEILPFRWNMEEIAKNNSWYKTDIYTISSCDANTLGKANRNTAKCEFIIMRANSAGNQEQVAKINLTNCFNANTSPLILSAINKQFAKIPNANKVFDGYSHYDGTSLFPSYGEYIIRLNKISYESCISTTTKDVINNKDITTYWRQSNTYSKAVCDYNFAVTKPYSLNRWASISSIWNESFSDYYGFGANSNIASNLAIKSIATKDLYSDSIKTAIDSFVNKYEKTNKTSAGKVQNKDIYILDGDYTWTDSKQTSAATIIVKWNLTIKGNITNNIAFIANTIKFETTDCNDTQTINGIYIARNTFVAGTNLQNINVNKNRCDDGRLLVKGKLIGNNIDLVKNSRRSYLNDWFNYDNAGKYKAIINWAAIKIEENAAIWNIPGINEIKSSLTITK